MRKKMLVEEVRKQIFDLKTHSSCNNIQLNDDKDILKTLNRSSTMAIARHHKFSRQTNQFTNNGLIMCAIMLNRALTDQINGYYRRYFVCH